jgi:hypothetical protein
MRLKCGRSGRLLRRPLGINSTAFECPIECGRLTGSDRLDLGCNTVPGATRNTPVALERNTQVEERNSPRMARNSRSGHGADGDGTRRECSENRRGSFRLPLPSKQIWQVLSELFLMPSASASFVPVAEIKNQSILTAPSGSSKRV